MAQVKSQDGFLGWILRAFRSEKERTAGDTIIKQQLGALAVQAADWEYQTRIAAMIRGDAWMPPIAENGGPHTPTGTPCARARTCY